MEALVDGELPAAEAEALRARLEKNPKAAQAAHEVERLHDLVKSLPRVAAPIDFAGAVVRRIASTRPRIAAAERVPSRRNDRASLYRSHWVMGGLAASLLVAAGLYTFQIPSTNRELAVVGNVAPPAVNWEKSLRDRLASDIDDLQNAIDRGRIGASAAVAKSDRDERRVVQIEGVPDQIEAPHELPAEPIRLDGKPLLNELASLRPGQLVQLNQRKITLVCVDVKKVADRLHYILTDHQLHAFVIDGEGKDGGGNAQEVALAERQFYEVEISVTPDRLHNVLADLHYVESSSPLIAKVDVEKPTPPRKIELPKESALGNLVAAATDKKSGAVEDLTNSKPGDGQSATGVAASRKDAAEGGRVDEKAVASKDSAPKAAEPASTEDAILLRVKFVLEPKSRS